MFIPRLALITAESAKDQTRHYTGGFTLRHARIAALPVKEYPATSSRILANYVDSEILGVSSETLGAFLVRPQYLIYDI